MKLTKKQTQKLESILDRLNDAIDFVNRDDVYICTDTLPNNLSYYDKNKNGITPIAKFIGSNLMQLINAKNSLKNFLNENGKGF